jgi:sterol desaturase/sphingolipid hydroxylase (fatty acid hydroxylase superfamily)
VYDFFYTLLHWFLHVKSIYAYVHKHHHHQKAPSRANIDAVNVHPLEFFLGEFNHILALHLVVKGIPMMGFHGTDVSWLGATIFIGMGGVLAGLNHTRHDITIRVGKKKEGLTVYDSKHHDVHHRIPQSNYGQYMVIWDRIFGTFREYDENDRVNPAYQLDPCTGQTIKSNRTIFK